jgi:hypothetical protein
MEQLFLNPAGQVEMSLNILHVFFGHKPVSRNFRRRDWGSVLVKFT